MAYTPTHVVTDMKDIRDEHPSIHKLQAHKKLDHIDTLCRVWIERSSFLTMATFDAAGRVDVSPKGDPSGFVRVLDTHTLAIPDRPGNHLFDSFSNILETGRIGLVFLVPRRNEVVRVNGSAQIVRDPDLLQSMEISGRAPSFALLVRVEEAFYHCGKSLIRSRLWDPEGWPGIEDLPTYGEALHAHTDGLTSRKEAEDRAKYNDEQRLYDE